MNKTVFMVAGASMIGLAAYLTFFINTTQVTTTKAGLFKNMMLGYELNTGEVIAAYKWDDGDLLKPEIGPRAIEISKDAVSSNGTENTKGIGPGKLKQPLNFVIPAVKELNLEGIDISVDYRKSENNCDLFSRGNQFNLGVKNGKLAIAYKLKLNNKTTTVFEVTRYEIPEDDEFRNYRFLYNPAIGKSEIFVNDVAIWSHESSPSSKLDWNEKDNLIVGRNLKGDGTNNAFIDNVVIKATEHLGSLPVTLLNFEAKAEQNHVMVTWYTASETEIDSFIIERSVNAKDFYVVGAVKATGGVDKLTAYALLDKLPNDGLAYYRLELSNKPLQSIVIAMMGYKYHGADGDLKVEDVPEANGK